MLSASMRIFNASRPEKHLTTFGCDAIIFLQFVWACSSAGRALRSQRRGQGFEPLQVHQKRNTAEKAVFFFAKEGSKRAVVNDVPFGTSEPLDPKASSLRESNPFGEHRLPPVTVS